MPKQNKLGIHKTVEDYTLKILTSIIDAAFRKKQEKIPPLCQARRDIETLKHLIRLEYELGIVKEKHYIILAELLENISMMATGWKKSLAT